MVIAQLAQGTSQTILNILFHKYNKNYNIAKVIELKFSKYLIIQYNTNISKDAINFANKNNSIKLNQEKWFKNIGQGNISIKDEIYTLMLTENKRELIFDNNNIFIETKPIKINLI